MAIEKLTENVEIVQTLSTYPNQEEGLSDEELKAKFDQGSKIIKDFLNQVLIPAVNEGFGDMVRAVAIDKIPVGHRVSFTFSKDGTLNTEDFIVENGHSPQVFVQEIPAGHKVIFEYEKDGELVTEAYIAANGQDGYSPQVRVAEVGGGHRVEIDYQDEAQGGAMVTKTFYVWDGVVPELDETLTVPGRAADAAAVGAALKKLPTTGGDAVTYTPQNPTEAQKAQARKNIGAVTAEDVMSIVDSKISAITNAEEVAY